MSTRRPSAVSRPARPVRVSEDLDWQGTPLRIVRSTARTRTVSGVWRDGRLQISVPARMGRAEEREWIERMVARAGPPPASPVGGRAPDPAGGAPDGPDAAQLLAWARRLSARHFSGRADPASVTWSARQHRRWGSCTPARRTIRLSAHLRGMPDWVVEAVLVHEVAHLREPGHGPRFQALVARYPRYTEAMAFLAGVTHAQARGLGAPGAGAEGAAHDVDGSDARDDAAAPGWDGDVEGE